MAKGGSRMVRVANQIPQPFQGPPGGASGGSPIQNIGTDPYQASYSMDQSMPQTVPQDMPGLKTGPRRIMKRGARRGSKASIPKRGFTSKPGMQPTGARMAF